MVRKWHWLAICGPPAEQHIAVPRLDRKAERGKGGKALHTYCYSTESVQVALCAAHEFVQQMTNRATANYRAADVNEVRPVSLLTLQSGGYFP